MAVNGFPSRAPNSQNFFSNSEKLSESFSIAVREGIDLISLVVVAQQDRLPHSHPKKIKDEISSLIPHHENIESLNLTRQGKLFITTKATTTAQEILGITSLLGIPVNVYIQTETITSRFILRIDSTVSCVDIASELTAEGLAILEVRRFMRNTQNGPEPTPTVLVTCVGTILPTEVKLWYQLFRISLFHDKPRHCLKCFNYTHSTKSCRSEKQLCSTCGDSHTGPCSSAPQCINCKGPHAATDSSCPRYQREVQIQKFKSSHHLTIRDARRQYNDNKTSSTRNFASVVSSTPSDSISRSDLDSALSSISSQFTTLVQNLVTEFRQTIASLSESIIQPIHDLIRELQSKKSVKANLQAIQDNLDFRNKKIKAAQDSIPVTSYQMDFSPSPPQFSLSNNQSSETLPINR